MAVKVGINGFGRIGRLVFRAMSEIPDRFDILAINDLADADMLGHLLKYDSTQGRFPGKVLAKRESLIVDGKKVRVCSERNPADLPWGKMGGDVCIEETGIFRCNKKDGKAGYASQPTSTRADDGLTLPDCLIFDEWQRFECDHFWSDYSWSLEQLTSLLSR